MKKTPLVILTAVLTLFSCTVGPDFTPPDTSTHSAYFTSGELPLPLDQKLALGKKIAGDWWERFHAPALDLVIKLALANNQDIAEAKARVAEATEGVNVAESALQPQVSLGATVGRQKYGAALFGPLDFTIPPFTYYTVGPNFSLPLDLFGGAKRTVEAREAYRKYKVHELEAAYFSLLANVTAQALTIALTNAEITSLHGIVEDDERNINLVKAALIAGSATRTQLLSAQSQLATDITLLPNIRQQQSIARHALATLVGKQPVDWVSPSFHLSDFSLPDEITGALPSELAHQRPDIMAAEAQLHVASAEIGVATANLYPNINLTGAFTQQALVPGKLFNGTADAWNVAASITQPLFDGGLREAERKASVDRYQAALASYRQIVLKSFEEVADSLQELSNDADQLRAQNNAAETAAATLDLARRSYAAGNSGILDVIDAERRLAQAQLGFSQAKAQRLFATAQLYLALGGNSNRIASETNLSLSGATPEKP